VEHFGVEGKVWGFDTFAGFPERRSVLDIYTSQADEFRDLRTVKAVTAVDNRIELVVGDISDTVERIRGVPLVMCLFDTDNYSGTRTALSLAYEQVVPGGILAFDHYYSPDWPETIGEQIAADELLDGAAVFHLHGTGIFLKWG